MINLEKLKKLNRKCARLQPLLRRPSPVSYFRSLFLFFQIPLPPGGFKKNLPPPPPPPPPLLNRAVGGEGGSKLCLTTKKIKIKKKNEKNT